MNGVPNWTATTGSSVSSHTMSRLLYLKSITYTVIGPSSQVAKLEAPDSRSKILT